MENFKEITLDDAIELVNKNAVIFNEDIIHELEANYEVAGKIVLYSGTTTLDNLVVGNDIVIVDGDLNITDIIEDCEGVDSSLLIVLGNVNCKSLITLSSIFITGDLNATNAIVGDSLCNLSLDVGGNIVTKTILEYGHAIAAEGTITVNDVFSFNAVQDTNGIIEQNLEREDMVDDIVEIDDDEKMENLWETIKYIKNGGEVFREA
ncbi:hypothetical protein [Flavobacterium hercynium]|uniref:Uncharacterized protein n=1 Tax=Flavobacterium hercynium TaxID=387094 RepID=A0A226H0D1_9FLAO|nr:hypothetical protein [Flavobacterium hercynium]OXA87298.1 hypothetical protein B0A66_16940 [Flavobacterium hercynium]SMP19776.1 hypothetical protein SAMN06265346_10672 [Flavobacterium hercynium]